MLRNHQNTIKVCIALFLVAMLGACGGSSSDSSSSPNSTPPQQPAPPPAPIPVEASDEDRVNTARLLTQGTFGPLMFENEAVATLVANEGVDAWINEQADKSATLHAPITANAYTRFPNDQEQIRRIHRLQAWWEASTLGEDQLRQRIAFALSQLFVVSEKSQLVNFQLELANYYDIHVRLAFGNYRDIMEEVTKSPVMGLYLSMLGNEKPQPERNIRPDENFARELMQLFTIGLHELNLDGSVVLDAQGNPIPTYTQADIEGYAHVFTGWNFSGATAQSWYRFGQNLNFMDPMTLVDEFHDTAQKNLLQGIVVPAGTDGEVALDIALDSLFDHPNLPPFVAKHFIQRLVTSNPSPDYIARVANTFIDNGRGVRGDMRALVTAILTDEEARDSNIAAQPTFGKVKAPIIRATNIVRALLPVNEANAQTPSYAQIANIDYFTNQAPLSSPSVFNFFSPNYQVNGELAELGMVTPEMQILTANYLVRNHNFAAFYLYSDNLQNAPNHIYADYSSLVGLLEAAPDELLEQLRLTLMQGNLDAEFIAVLQDYDTQITPFVDESARVREYLNLILTSPQFAIQR